jgi:hypothetical protein
MSNNRHVVGDIVHAKKICVPNGLVLSYFARAKGGQVDLQWKLVKEVNGTRGGIWQVYVELEWSLENQAAKFGGLSRRRVPVGGDGSDLSQEQGDYSTGSRSQMREWLG